MRELAHRYREIRGRQPDGKPMTLFDVAGTILDMLHMIVFVLQSFDWLHGTSFFRRLGASDVAVRENRTESFLPRCRVVAVAFRI